MSALIVFCMVPNVDEANLLAKKLVSEHQAACVNIIQGVQSIFRWEGKIQSAAEMMLVIKTTVRRFPQLRRRIEALHSYDVPEILAIPVVGGNAAYLKWLTKMATPPSKRITRSRRKG